MSKDQKQTSLEEFIRKTGLDKVLEELPHLKDKQDVIGGAKDMLDSSDDDVDKAVKEWNQMIKQIKNTPHPPK